MRSPEGKGHFSSSISQQVIDEALKSVEKHEPAPAVSAEADSAGPPTQPTDEAREALSAQLEVSLAHGRDLLAKLKDEHERMLRAAADLDNYKKRAAKEKEELQRYGSEKLLRDLLPVLDNLDRALEHARAPADYESLRKGVEMIRRLHEDALAKHGAKAFHAKGKPFDPAMHEAMTQQETAELPPNHVVTEVVRGFTLNDRLMRPALVVVSCAPTSAAAASAPAQAQAQAQAPEPPPAPDDATTEPEAHFPQDS